MIANILIASSFFALGFIVGGVFVVSTCWKHMKKLAKDLNEAQSDPLILRVYERKN